MKLRYVKAVAAGLAGIGIIMTIWIVSGQLTESHDQNIIRHLIMTRIDAMNLFYASEMSYIEASGELRKVEGGHLLEEDTTNLRRYFRTDIDDIQDYSISRIELKDRTDNLLSAEVDIQWNVTGLDGPEMFENTYFAMCEKDGEKFKLTEFF